MSNDIPSWIQALILGVIFVFIGYEFLTISAPAGIGSAFAHNIGWAFALGGAISFLAGTVPIIRHFR